MNRKAPPQIIHQQLALDAYLKNLLEEIPGTEDATPETLAKPSSASKQRPAVDADTLVARDQIHGQAPLVEAEKPAKLQPLSVMPAWAQHEFQALFFKVDELILATPLIDLSRTIKIEHAPGKIPGQPSWFLGLLDDHGCRIGVLDTGQLILGKTRGGQRNLQERPFKLILVTEDQRWGLACDEVLNIAKIKPESVRWRTLRHKKPWLIGTVIDELTAVIDVRQLVPRRAGHY